MIKKIFNISLFILFIPTLSIASFISIQTTIQSNVEENKINLGISLVNKGDESAYDVQAEIVFENKPCYTPKISELEPNQEIAFNKQIQIPSLINGDYPLIIISHYTDANKYPFSALSCITVSSRSDPLPSDIFGRMETTSFSNTGTVKIKIKNRGEIDISASISLFVPKELTINPHKLQATIPAKSEQEIKFDIENFSALTDSNYQVFAVAEYEKNEYHHAGIIQGKVSIIKSKVIWGLTHKLVFIILILFLIVFIAAQYMKRK